MWAKICTGFRNIAEFAIPGIVAYYIMYRKRKDGNK